MVYTFSFITEIERNNIIEQNKDKRLIEIKYLTKGNELVFLDKDSIETRIDNTELSIDKLKKQSADMLFMIMQNQGGAV